MIFTTDPGKNRFCQGSMPYFLTGFWAKPISLTYQPIRWDETCTCTWDALACTCMFFSDTCVWKFPIFADQNLKSKGQFILEPHPHPHPQGKQKMYYAVNHWWSASAFRIRIRNADDDPHPQPQPQCEWRSASALRMTIRIRNRHPHPQGDSPQLYI